MTPTEVVEAVKNEFDVEIERQHVRNYNPLQVEKARAKWGEIFETARKAFLDSRERIGIAHQVYRLSELQKLYHQAGKNIVLKKELLEQAAKEDGGAFTNKKEISGPGGGSIPVAITGTIDKFYGDGDES